LWTNPSAEQAAKCGGEQHNENDEGDHRETENEKVLRPEYFSKQDKFCLRYIEKKQWPAVNMYKWERHEKEKESQAGIGSPGIKPSPGLLRKNPFALAASVNRRDPVAERFGAGFSSFLH